MLTSPALTKIAGPEDFAAAFGVSDEALHRLATYETLLRRWQETINLVSPSTLDAIWHRHFADSAQLVMLAPHARSWIDLGSGAGFPGLVVAILLAVASSPSPLVGEGQGGGDGRTGNVGAPPTPNPSPQGGGGPAPFRGEIAHVTLVESNARKCAFLREVVRLTRLSASVTVDILSTRIEATATQASLQAPDVVSARALAPLAQLFNLSAPLFTPRTVGLFLKGRDAAAELEAAGKMWTFNAELVPSRTEPDAHIVVVRHLEAKAKSKGKMP